MANNGLTCRGALVRDVMALGITTLVVSLSLLKGEVGKSTTSLFVGIYVLFVLIVLVADVYHRAVMLPRLSQQAEMVEQQRQLDAERAASDRAGNALNGYYDSSDSNDAASGAQPEAGCNGPGNGALTAVLNALSNYSKDDDMEFDTQLGHQRSSGWGVESSVEGLNEWDRPIVLRGPNGLLSRQQQHHHQTPDRGTNNDDNFDSPYRIMEDLEMDVENVCISSGSTGFAAHNWVGAIHDGKQELIAHFRACWVDILDDDDSSRFEKFLLICEFPITICRKVSFMALIVNSFMQCCLSSRLHSQIHVYFLSSPCQYLVRVHTVVHSLPYHWQYLPFGLVCMLGIILIQICGVGN